MPNKTIQVGPYTIGEAQPVFMIAEIGINHNGDIQIVKKLTDAAFACDWQCVKFQKRTPDICVPEHQKGVMRETPWGEMTYLEYKHRVEFGREEYDYIDSYCKEKPIQWSVSVWDIPSLNFIRDYDIPFIKIPSAKLTDDELITEASLTGKPVFLSTGMSTMDEVDHAVEILEKHTKGNFLLMHTNSAYPAPHDELNLKMIGTLRDRYNCLVGYSGHEYDLSPTEVAAFMGVNAIERHITLDHGMWGTDQAASLEVHAMDMLNKRIRAVGVMLGDGKKVVMPSEISIKSKLRGTK